MSLANLLREAKGGACPLFLRSYGPPFFTPVPVLVPAHVLVPAPVLVPVPDRIYGSLRMVLGDRRVLLPGRVHGNIHNMELRIWGGFGLGLLFWGFAFGLFADQPLGPDQPRSGLGGSAYPHSGFRQAEFGAFEERTLVFVPTGPLPASAPVVIFLHGWVTSDPGNHLGWIEHLCRRGWIVVYPLYQGSGEHSSRFFLNVVRSVKEAFKRLYDDPNIQPDRERVAVIGHEVGGVLAANLAASARYFKIPVPKVVMVLYPSRHANADAGENKGVEILDLSGIRAGTLLMTIVGEKEDPNSYELAREIFYSADNVLTRDKNFVTFLSDFHGKPPLVADRFSALTPREARFEREIDTRRFEFINTFRAHKLSRWTRCRGIDAMDWFGTFRLFDGLCDPDIGRRSRNIRRELPRQKVPREFVLGNTELQRFMGFWSDGIPIRGLLATERP